MVKIELQLAKISVVKTVKTVLQIYQWFDKFQQQNPSRMNPNLNKNIWFSTIVFCILC